MKQRVSEESIAASETFTKVGTKQKFRKIHGKRNVNKEYTRRRDKVTNDVCLYVR